MRKIIPFKKDLPFNKKVHEITSISLEKEIEVLEDYSITGTFHILGDFKMNEASINREKFNFDLPFDIALDPNIDISSVLVDIDNFYYELENEDTLKVNIDLYLEAAYKEVEPISIKEIEADSLNEEEKNNLTLSNLLEDNILDVRNIKEKERTDSEKIDSNESKIEDNIINRMEVKKEEKKEKDNSLDKERDINNSNDSEDITKDLFTNLDSCETYTTYYVYLVKESDTLEGILNKYSVTKEILELYNDSLDLKPGMKIIVPEDCEQ